MKREIIKLCSKCGFEKSIVLFNSDKNHTDKLTSWCKMCINEYNKTPKARATNNITHAKYEKTDKGKATRKKYLKTDKGKITQRKSAKKNQQTVKGYLRHRYAGIKFRCDNPECKEYKYYGGRGIELRFTSDEFVNYVIDLGIDIHKLDVHRIDSNGHYELDNIEFLTRKEHKDKHTPRVITELEETAFRLCSHEFKGLTIREAAIKMELREHIVRRLLKSMKSKAPQLFPILTKRQYLIYRLYVEHGYSQLSIAKRLKTTQPAIQATLNRMKKMGMPGIDVNGTEVVRYDNSMDAHIKRKF